MTEEEAAAPALHVLVVEALAGPAAVVRDMLEAQGHRVMVAHDWRMAETILTLHPIAAVVMPVAMPGVPQGAAAQQMRAGAARWSGLPLVGLGGEADRRDAATAGFDALVVRPHGPEALAAGLRDAVRLRMPVVLVDATFRATLRQTHGPAALAARDEAAMARAAQVVEPLLSGAATRAGMRDAVAVVAEAMEGVGALHAAGLARRAIEAGPRGLRDIHPLLQAIVASRFALRTDRMNAAGLDPIWAASDTPPGESP